ncbi:tetratricopeptide repeat protein [Asticcacaulis sp. 201]|uniref:tetratricopeptide repeat protein n=1 Tax=Asticcacaulis sp. 201 TaxID=3028787 RepID=UPI002916995E|nr:tetratricopeptide repeat protein [Asticcacaulis sp. 201]MDV6329521.1 tetratricopeptide repeat protein [Asticcacaulis sp. 201]
MSDIFDETEENLRADKWVSIVKRALPWVIGVLVAALVITLAIAGYSAWQNNASAKASEVYAAGIESLAKGDKAVAKTKFEEAAKAGNKTYTAMAYQHLAGIALDDKNTPEAIKDLDLAAKATSIPMISDGAALKSAMLAMDTTPYADIEKRLTPLTKEGRPYAALAKEALAMAKLQKGDVKGARSDLQVLSVTLGTPDGVKQRASAFVAAIDSGAVTTAQALVKLPEAPMPVMPQMQPGAQMQQMPAQ